MLFWGFSPTRFASRFSSMKALVGGGIQRRQRIIPTVTAITASSVRQRIRRTLENREALGTGGDFTDAATTACSPEPAPSCRRTLADQRGLRRLFRPALSKRSGTSSRWVCRTDRYRRSRVERRD